MLKVICNYIVNKEQYQDWKDFINNVASDIIATNLVNRK